MADAPEQGSNALAVANGEAAAQNQIVDNNQSGPDAPGAGQFSDAMMERPAFIPEKFFKDGRIDIKALAESYGELERTRSSQPPAPKPDVTELGDRQADGSKAPSQKADPNAAPEIVIPGVNKASMEHYTKELTEGGKLSDASYADLAKLGYPKAVVDSYVKGLQADAMVSQAIQDVRIADAEIATITASIGGEKTLGKMLQWASSNLDAKDLAVYNEAVSGNDPARVKMAVQGMFHAFKQASGPNLIGGRPSVSTSEAEPFNSNDEVIQAMEDPRYDRDPSYRDQVAKRIAVSNVFGQSREYKTKDSY